LKEKQFYIFSDLYFHGENDLPNKAVGYFWLL